MTVAASAMAERKTFGHPSWRVAIRRQSLIRPNMISMRWRRRYRRLSYLIGAVRDSRGGMQARILLSDNALRNQSASYLWSAISRSA